MNTQHLLYALEVARFGSYSRAAQSLEIGQPTLSKAVSELEKTLGITIFQRSARGVVPSEEGQEFLRLAGETLKQIRRMESLHRSGAGREALWISIPPSAYILEAVTDFFSELDPAETIDVRVRENRAQEVAQDVAEGRSRLGVLRCPPARERFFRILLPNSNWKPCSCGNLICGAPAPSPVLCWQMTLSPMPWRFPCLRILRFKCAIARPPMRFCAPIRGCSAWLRPCPRKFSRARGWAKSPFPAIAARTF